VGCGELYLVWTFFHKGEKFGCFGVLARTQMKMHHRGSPLSQYVLNDLLNLALACNQEYCFITESDNQVIIINMVQSTDIV